MTFPRRFIVTVALTMLMAFPALAQNPVPDPGESVQPRDIAYWRSRIDNVDRRIIGMLNERAEHVAQLIPLKADANRAVRDPKREAEVLARLKARNQGPLPDESIVRIYEAIMAEMRLLQETAGGK